MGDSHGQLLSKVCGAALKQDKFVRLQMVSSWTHYGTFSTRVKVSQPFIHSNYLNITQATQRTTRHFCNSRRVSAHQGKRGQPTRPLSIAGGGGLDPHFQNLTGVLGYLSATPFCFRCHHENADPANISQCGLYHSVPYSASKENIPSDCKEVYQMMQVT